LNLQERPTAQANQQKAGIAFSIVGRMFRLDISVALAIESSRMQDF
jgi:hypothetical protein